QEIGISAPVRATLQTLDRDELRNLSLGLEFFELMQAWTTSSNAGYKKTDYDLVQDVFNSIITDDDTASDRRSEHKSRACFLDIISHLRQQKDSLRELLSQYKKTVQDLEKMNKEEKKVDDLLFVTYKALNNLEENLRPMLQTLDSQDLEGLLQAVKVF